MAKQKQKDRRKLLDPELMAKMPKKEQLKTMAATHVCDGSRFVFLDRRYSVKDYKAARSGVDEITNQINQ